MQVLPPEHSVEEWSPQSPAEQQAVLEQMERILASVHFRNSKRYPVLLRYVVEETLQGHSDSLKERTLGVLVFQREAAYDTNNDPIVRITAGEVRKRIAQYYHDSGHKDELRIDLPPGSYIPHFRLQSGGSGESEHAVAEVLISEPVSPAPTQEIYRAAGGPTSNRRLWFVPACVFLALVVAGLIWFGFHRHKSPLDLAWYPLLEPNKTILLSVGEPTLANRTEPVIDPQTLTVGDHVRKVDYLVFSDVQALTRIVGQLDRYERPYRLQAATETSFADLRQGPSVLLGGFDNPWTVRALRPLRFRLVRDLHGLCWIEDQHDASNKKWAVDFTATYAKLAQDYAIVARFTDGDTHQPVIIVAGVGENGTKAASEFFTDPENLRLWSGNGSEWKGQNFEAVLGTQVINGVSGPPVILDKEVW